MKTFSSIAAVLLAAGLVSAQNSSAVTIPATNGSLPVGGANGCAAGYYPGSDTVIFTVPYNYTQVLSIIGNYTNLTWSGSPDNSVTTNNSQALATNNWTPGTARFYSIGGAYVIETITTYSKPANGPYVEVHTLAPLSIAAANVSFYGNFDGQIYQPVCGGKAMYANYTINFCATNASVAAALLHSIHLTDAQTVGKFLGGQNFTSCAALGVTNSTAPVGGYGNATGYAVLNGTTASNTTASNSTASATRTGTATGTATGMASGTAASGTAAGGASGTASASGSAATQSRSAAADGLAQNSVGVVGVLAFFALFAGL